MRLVYETNYGKSFVYKGLGMKNSFHEQIMNCPLPKELDETEPTTEAQRRREEQSEKRVVEKNR